MRAIGIGARALFLTTAVDRVYVDFGKPNQRALDVLTMSEANQMLNDGVLPAGSMAPKVKSATRFIAHGGEIAVICSPSALVPALRGESGTSVVA